MDAPYRVLFVCTGNSARSIMAESILRHRGGERFRAYSAGSHPVGAVHPWALELLIARGLPTDGLRSKHWDEFARAPKLDFVFTVCDAAAGEACPTWRGQPLTAHWGVENPVAVRASETEQRRAFLRVYTELERRIELFLALPLATIDRLALKRELDLIGKGGRSGKTGSAKIGLS